MSFVDVFVFVYGEFRKVDFGGFVIGIDKVDFVNVKVIRCVDFNLINDIGLFSNRFMESRIIDLGSEVSWEFGKSRFV